METVKYIRFWRGGNMSSSKEYLDFIMEQLSGLDDVKYRTMMGEYIIYYRKKIIGGIYDDRLLVKPVWAALSLIGEDAFELPYEGAKKCCSSEKLITGISSRNFLKLCTTNFRNQAKRNKTELHH